jgi:hypothetical protein
MQLFSHSQEHFAAVSDDNRLKVVGDSLCFFCGLFVSVDKSDEFFVVFVCFFV